MSDETLTAGAAPRNLVPSDRQLLLGVAADPVVPLPLAAATRINAREVLSTIRECRPRIAAGGQPTLPLILFALGALFTTWDDAAFAVLLPRIKDDLGLDIGYVLTLGAVVALVVTLISPVTGYLADRLNRVGMGFVGGVIANASSIAAGLTGTPSGLALARVGAGVGTGISTPAGLPLLTDLYPAETRAQQMSFLQVAATGGTILGPIVSGGLGAFFGWRVAISALGAFAVLVSSSLLLIREPKRGAMERRQLGADPDAPEPPKVPWAEGWRMARSIGTLRRIWYAAPFLIAGGTALSTLYVLYFSQEFGLTSFQIGVLGTVNATAALFGLAFAGPVTDRLLAVKPARVFAMIGAVMSLTGVVFVVLVASPYLWLSLVVMLPVAIANALITPALYTLQTLVVPARIRGFALQTIAPWQVLGLLFIVALGQVGSSTNLRSAMVVLIPVQLVGAALIGSAGGSFESDMRAAAAAAVAQEAATAADRPLLVCRGVELQYQGAQVLHGVDLDVREGEIVALLGTNGAGKSSLLRAVSGIHEASGGAIFFDGADITHRPAYLNAEAGIALMPGGRAVYPSLTVAENLRTATWLRREDAERTAERLAELEELFPVLRDRADEVAGNLSGGEQQMVALAQALLMRPRLLMIDELSLGLSPSVVDALLEVVREINAQGTTVLLVEQSANVALTLATRSIFLERGAVRFDGPTAELLGRSDLLRAVFLGGAGGGAKQATPLRRPRLHGGAESREESTALQVDGLSVSFGGRRVLDQVSLEVSSGEVLGIIGPNGAGKTTLFDTISGYVAPEAGHVVVAGVDVSSAPPHERARHGLARSFQNARLFTSMTVRECIATALEQHLGNRSAVAAALWLPHLRRSERKAAQRVDYLVELFNLETMADRFVGELSTGTRRTVDLACVMAAEPSVLLLDEPSSGLAQAEVEALGVTLRRYARERSCALVVIEHDIAMISALADRLMVLELGRTLTTGSPATVLSDPEVVRAYLTASSTTLNRSGDQLAGALAPLAAAATRGHVLTPSVSGDD